MNIAYFIGLIALFTVTGSHGLTAVEFAKKCIHEYRTLLTNYNSNQGTCTRFQIYVDCLSKRRELTSQWIDAMRYSNTQYALFFTKLNVCPDIDYKDLKEIADKTDYAKQYGYMDKIRTSDADQCAVEIFKKCHKIYLKLFVSTHKICNDLTEHMDCLNKEMSEGSCNSQILNEFVKTMNRVGYLTVREIRRHAGLECKSEL